MSSADGVTSGDVMTFEAQICRSVQLTGSIEQGVSADAYLAQGVALEAGICQAIALEVEL